MCSLVIRVLNIHFNPRSHERSDIYENDLLFYLNISIHAPTRGATKKTAYKPCTKTISIHAPTRGATIIATMHKTVV